MIDVMTFGYDFSLESSLCRQDSLGCLGMILIRALLRWLGRVCMSMGIGIATIAKIDIQRFD